MTLTDAQDLIGRTVVAQGPARRFRLYVEKVEDFGDSNNFLLLGLLPSVKHPGDFRGRSWTLTSSVLSVED